MDAVCKVPKPPPIRRTAAVTPGNVRARFLLLVSLLLAPAVSNAVPFKDQVPQAEYDVLVELYNATGGENWTNKGGWLDPEASSWFGISVSGNKVSTINLAGNELTGEIPSSLGNLTELIALYLYSNELTGGIPDSLGNLNKLASLWLQSNQLTGEIPVSLGNLTELLSLNLSVNQLTGGIPDSLGNLTKLLSLQLAGNGLTGEIPGSLGNLTALMGLFLNNNELTGVIPDSLGNLTNLQQFHLYRNQLTGEIPGSLGNLTALTSLLLFNNLLATAVVSDEWIQLLDQLVAADVSVSYLPQGEPEVDLFLEIPLQPELIGPVEGEEVMARRPVLSWNPATGGTWHQVWLSRNGRTYLSKWVAGQNLDAFLVPNALPGGNYTWWVRAYNSNGTGSWSQPGSFIVPVRVPKIANLTGPLGSIMDKRPDFTWDAASDATWQQLWITKDGAKWASPWVEGEGSATWSPDSDLRYGGYRWWVRGWNPDGYSPWSDGATFSYGKAEPQYFFTLSSVLWDPVPNATWYRIFLTDSSGSPVHSEWISSSDADMAFDQIRFNMPDFDVGSSYRIWLRSWSPTDGSIWSDPVDFVYED